MEIAAARGLLWPEKTTFILNKAILLTGNFTAVKDLYSQFMIDLP
jgi:hypothetical protein